MADRGWRVGVDCGFGFAFGFGCWAVRALASSRELFIPLHRRSIGWPRAWSKSAQGDGLGRGERKAYNHSLGRPVNTDMIRLDSIHRRHQFDRVLHLTAVSSTPRLIRRSDRPLSETAHISTTTSMLRLHRHPRADDNQQADGVDLGSGQPVGDLARLQVRSALRLVLVGILSKHESITYIAQLDGDGQKGGCAVPSV